MVATINADTTNGVVITSDTSGEIELQANGVTKAKVTANGLQDANGNSLRGGSFRNLVINGDMRISQRGTGTVNPNAAYVYSVDRTAVYTPTSGIITAGQSTTAPDNFTHSFLVTSTTATSVGAGDINIISHRIEGNNIAHLGWGTANAKTVTLSFWVKSSLTGTFAGAFKNNAYNRNYVFEYTISAANTWEKKTITVAGDTTGTWESGTSSGIQLVWSLGTGSTYSTTAGSWVAGQYFNATGSVNLVATSGATFYITGIQLEVGSGASDFEFLPYDVQLARCQRYFEHNFGTGYAIGSAKAYPNNIGCEINGFTTTNGQKHYNVPYKVVKRAIPTVTIYDGNGNVGKVTTTDLGGTPTHNANIGLIFVNDQFVGAGAGNGTHSGINYFFVSSAEL